VPAVVAVLDDSPVARSARSELVRGVTGMLGRTLREESAVPRENAIVIGTVTRLGSLIPAVRLTPDAFWLPSVDHGSLHFTVIAAVNDRGQLYGAFALLRKIELGESLANLDRQETPYAPVHWANHRDRLNGTIERGYGGIPSSGRTITCAKI
jgi:alpha-glucuronidase